MATPHVKYEQLIAYAAGTLPPAQAAAVEAHLASNPQDAQTVARYRMAKQLVATDDSVEPSTAAIARAKAIFTQHATQQATKPERLGWLEAVDRFIARLVFDSRVQPVGVRYADMGGVGGRINLTFETEQAEIDLQAERIAEGEGTERWRLMGQVSLNQPHESPRGAGVALATAGTRNIVAEGRADERGGFTFETAPGKYDVLFQTPKGVMVAPSIEIS